MKSMHVLEAPLLVTDYDELAASCVAWAQGPRCRAVEFVNTQVVTMRRHDPAFRQVMDSYDALVPDGMPLVWCLNRSGARMRDRVYGPTFMRRFLETAPAGSTHYLLGGTQACGHRLRERFAPSNPGLRFVGSFHGRCDVDGTIAGDRGERIEEINRLSPDYLWVGLGTPKQQAWVHRNKQHIRRGVILGVGFAFEVNAGIKPDAPGWMQRASLTWLHRAASEPQRLAPRYLKWNSLFVFYLLSEKIRGRGR